MFNFVIFAFIFLCNIIFVIIYFSSNSNIFNITEMRDSFWIFRMIMLYLNFRSKVLIKRGWNSLKMLNLSKFKEELNILMIFIIGRRNKKYKLKW